MHQRLQQIRRPCHDVRSPPQSPLTGRAGQSKNSLGIQEVDFQRIQTGNKSDESIVLRVGLEELQVEFTDQESVGLGKDEVIPVQDLQRNQRDVQV
jgi:hypothetical protein